MNIKPIKAMLHTAGKTDEEILKQSGLISPEEIPKARKIIEAWDGIEVIVDATLINEQIQQYALIGWDEQDCEIDGRIKEVIYLMEQDPMFGTYVNDRERFELDWAEKRYEPAGSIVFEPEDIEILEETPAQRLARLITNHPDLSVIPMVDWEVCADCTGRWAANIGRAYIAEYVWEPDNRSGDPNILYRYKAVELVDAMAENAETRIKPQAEPVFVKPDPFFPEGETEIKRKAEEERKRIYEAARQQAWEKVNSMRWKKALFVEIDLPEDLEE